MTTPAITEIVRDIDQVLGDINDIEDRAKSLADRMGAPVQDSHDITSRAVIARDMLREITAIVEGFETGETRDRQVEEPAAWSQLSLWLNVAISGLLANSFGADFSQSLMISAIVAGVLVAWVDGQAS